MLLTRRMFAGSMAGAALAAQTSPRKPNILIFLVDDMGLGDIGPYGVRDTKTPHLDKLASAGVRFTDSYSNGPVCTPTRCALMTGRYQQRYGLEWALVPAQRDLGLPSTEATLPRLLKDAGYRTGMFGKWHLGTKPEHAPNAHGFEEFFGILGGNVDHYTHKNINGAPDLYEGTELVAKDGYLTELLTERAVGYLDRHARERASQPFLLYVAYNAVHWPFQPPGRPDARTRETWMTGSRADYIRMVESIDTSVGQILGALDKHKMTGDTLVIFTNDNGGERFSRNSPAFHHKGTLWEGGIRVPAMLRWPGHIPGGAVSREPVITMDLAATALAAAGARARSDRPLEGIDLVPVANGRKPAERPLFWRIQRDERKQRAVRRGRYKYIRDANIEMVFDLEKDPTERTDIAMDHPALLAELRAAVAEWERDVAKNAPAVLVQ